MQEHPQADGNCWFHFYADYLGDPDSYADMFTSTVAQFSNHADQGPPMTLHLDNGEDLLTHDDAKLGNYGIYQYDDGMCYQAGWMKGQRLDEHMSKLFDREAWLKLAEQECARLPGLSPDGLKNSTKLTIGFMGDDNMRIADAATCLSAPRDAPCRKATVEDWAYHLYPKCLLGQPGHPTSLAGAAGQIAWCFARACVEGNVIKHGANCWPNGLPW